MIQIGSGYAIYQDDLLGLGSTGKVYLGYLSKDHNKKFAIKEMNVTNFNNPTRMYLLNCQISAMTDLTNKNCNYIVKLITQPLYKDKFIYLVMETLKGGSLKDYIEQHYGGVEEKQALKLFKQILQGYQVIKQQGIIHRDIKADNFMFRKELEKNDDDDIINIEQNQLCFIDFGYCSKQNVPGKPNQPIKVGSLNYMSPEAFINTKYSQKSDIWAIGVVFYQILHGQTVRKDMPYPQYFEMMKNGGLTNQKGITQQVWNLLLGMLAYHPNKRFDHKTTLQRLNIILSGGKPPPIITQQQQQQFLNTNYTINKKQSTPTNNNDIFAEMLIKKPVKKQNDILRISEKYQIDQDDVIGKGATANVYLGFEIADKLRVKNYAVKEIDYTKITHPVAKYLLHCELQSLQELSQANCPYIVKTYEIIQNKKYYYIVMELLMGGSLGDYIRDNSKGIPQKEALALFKQIIKGYGELRKRRILHRDIKPDNFVFRKSKQNNGQNILQNQLCFIDFGFCINQSVQPRPAQPSKVGSLKYMSPQLHNHSQYSQKSDIWAMGVVLYEMLHGKTINAGMNMEQCFYKIQTGNITNYMKISQGVWQLILGMLGYRVQDRLGYQQIQRKLSVIQKGLQKPNDWNQKQSHFQRYTSINQNETLISINSVPNSTQKNHSRFVIDPSSSKGMTYTQRKIMPKKVQPHHINKFQPSKNLETYAAAIVSNVSKKQMFFNVKNNTMDGKKSIRIERENVQPSKPYQGPNQPLQQHITSQYGLSPTSYKQPYPPMNHNYNNSNSIKNSNFKFNNNYINPSTNTFLNVRVDQIDGIGKLPSASNNISPSKGYLANNYNNSACTTTKNRVYKSQQHNSHDGILRNQDDQYIYHNSFTVIVGRNCKKVIFQSPKKSPRQSRVSPSITSSPIVNNFINSNNRSDTMREFQQGIGKVNQSGNKGSAWRGHFSAFNTNNSINNNAYNNINIHPFQIANKNAQLKQSTPNKLIPSSTTQMPNNYAISSNNRHDVALNKDAKTFQYPSGNFNVDNIILERKFCQSTLQQQKKQFLHISNVINNQPYKAAREGYYHQDTFQTQQRTKQPIKIFKEVQPGITINGKIPKLQRKKIFHLDSNHIKQANIKQTLQRNQHNAQQQYNRFNSNVREYKHQKYKQSPLQLSKDAYINNRLQSSRQIAEVNTYFPQHYAHR